MLPVQLVPVYPLTHLHCDYEHTVLASTSVHSEVDVQFMPTMFTAEIHIGNI